MDIPKTTITVGGTSFLNLLFLVFLSLKLTNVISWSWWWVTAPLWGPVALAIVTIVVGVMLVVISAGLTNRNDRWRV